MFMNEQAESVLAEILTLVLERPVAAGEVVRRADEPKWDSLKHLEIIMAVEAAFGVSFTTDEMSSVSSSVDLARKTEAAG
jgi:acyl carrier protein